MECASPTEAARQVDPGEPRSAPPPRTRVKPVKGRRLEKEMIRMSSGGYYNGPVADWARRNIRGRVEVTPRFSSRLGRIFVYALLFCAPGAFIALGLLLFALGARAKDGAGALLFYGFLMLIPCGMMALVGAYVRRGFAKSLDAEGARGAFGQRLAWGKLYHVDHDTKVVIRGGVRRPVKDNQLELVFEGGKVIIPPLIHEREAVWSLINSLPAEVRDDGVSRAARAAAAREELLAFLKSSAPPRNRSE